MSKIYTNAVIHTEDPKNPQADTVVIDDGKFSYVGKAAGYAVKEEDEVIDLGGEFVIPGLIDSHQHWSLPAPSKSENRQTWWCLTGIFTRSRQRRSMRHSRCLQSSGEKKSIVLPRTGVI